MPVTNLSLFKRPNGFWYILYTDGGRRIWKSTKCTERSEALKKLTEFKDLVRTRPAPNNLSCFVRDFLSFARSTYAKASVDIFTIALRHLQAITGDCGLSEVSYKHLDLYKAQRLQTVTPTTVNVELRSLRTIFNAAVRWSMIEANPFSKMQLVRIPETMPAFFSKEDFRRFLSVVGNHPLRDVFLFAVLTGLRRGEILNLKWSDVNLLEKTAHIHSSVTYRVKASKRRVIPLSDQAVALLVGRRAVSSSEYVFDYNGKIIKGNHVAHSFKKLIRNAGLNEKLHFHSCRHSHATWLVQNRVSIYEVQKLLGHSDISTTQIYSHLVSSELHEAVNRIGVVGESVEVLDSVGAGMSNRHQRQVR